MPHLGFGVTRPAPTRSLSYSRQDRVEVDPAAILRAAVQNYQRFTFDDNKSVWTLFTKDIAGLERHFLLIPDASLQSEWRDMKDEASGYRAIGRWHQRRGHDEAADKAFSAAKRLDPSTLDVDGTIAGTIDCCPPLASARNPATISPPRPALMPLQSPVAPSTHIPRHRAAAPQADPDLVPILEKLMERLCNDEIALRDKCLAVRLYRARFAGYTQEERAKVDEILGFNLAETFKLKTDIDLIDYASFSTISQDPPSVSQDPPSRRVSLFYRILGCAPR